MLKADNVQVGLVETMDQAAQDMSAQLSKIKATDSDTIMVTTAVEQLTLMLKQATALGIKKQIITTGGSQNPDQLIEQAGVAANGTYPPHHFRAVVSGRHAESRTPPSISSASGRSAASTSPARPRASAAMTASAPSPLRSRRPARRSRRRSPTALWKTELMGLNGKIKFEKEGPAGKESGQSMPNVYLIKIDNAQGRAARSCNTNCRGHRAVARCPRL